MNVWRCFLQLVGGLGIIVLAVAILPLLGVGGAQLFKTEMTGPMKDARLTPRIAETARGLWVVYFVGCVACFFAYRWAGMSWADAFMHMCTTMSLAGFSSHDASFGYWNSPLIEAVAVFFMMLAGVSVALYFVAWRQRSLRPLWRNVEARAFVGVMVGAVLLISLFLWLGGTYASYAESLRHTVFHVVSVGTTTGYATQDYAQWPPFAPLLMLLLGCFATCGGSTGGGIKMMRMLLLLKQAQHELVRIVHPSVVNPVVIGGAGGAAAGDAEHHRLHDGLRRHAGGADDAAGVQRAGRGHRLHRGGGLRQQHRPRPGRASARRSTTAASATSRPGSAPSPWCWAGWRCCRCWCCSRRSSGAGRPHFGPCRNVGAQACGTVTASTTVCRPTPWP